MSISIDGARLLASIRDFISRYVVISPEASVVLAAWVVHTHAVDVADRTPYMIIRSATPRCGKSRLLDVLEQLVANPQVTSSITTSALMRTIGEFDLPTVLLDEQDGLKGARGVNDVLRTLLNAGFERGRPVIVNEPSGRNGWKPTEFPVFCPKAIATIGALPGTVMDRGVVIELKRKMLTETVASFRKKDVSADAEPLRDATASWALGQYAVLQAATPDMPSDLDDRAKDMLEPLIAIADLAGGEWPSLVREAVVALRAVKDDESDIAVRLLSDIRSAFEARKQEFLFTEDLLDALTSDPTAPWCEWRRGYPMTARALARQLASFGIEPDRRQVKSVHRRGYLFESFRDAFGRYLDVQVTTEESGSTSVDPPNGAQLHTDINPFLLARVARLTGANSSGEAVPTTKAVERNGTIDDTEPLEPIENPEPVEIEPVEAKNESIEIEDVEDEDVEDEDVEVENEPVEDEDVEVEDVEVEEVTS